MRIGNTATEWGVVQQALHWATFLLVLAQVWFGLSLATAMPGDPDGARFVRWHVGIGSAIFAITLLRLVWRSMHPVPRLPDDLTQGQKSIARGTHYGLYGVLLVQPVTGYLTWAGREGRFPFDSPTEVWFFSVLHALGVAVLVMLASVHILAALRHELALKDNVLRRMTPLARRPDAADRQPPPEPGAL